MRPLLPIKSQWLAVLVSGGLLFSSAPLSAQGVSTDLWDVQKGATVLSDSGFGAAPGVNIFGGNAASPEAGRAFFRDDRSAGFVHFVEFESAVGFGLTGYRLIIGDDAVSGDRGVSEFRLFVWVAGTSSFQLVDTYSPPSHPYGNLPAEGTVLDIQRPVTPVTGQRFRAEFVQSGALGPRVIELDAVSVPPAVAILSPAHQSVLSAPFYNFSGTASDLDGIDSVKLRILRKSDFNYWNGLFWTASVTDLPANFDAGNGTWTPALGLTFILPIPPGESMPEGDYEFIAIAEDVTGESTEVKSQVNVGNRKSYTYTAAAGQKCNPSDPNEQVGDPKNWSDPRNWGPVCDPQGPPTGNDIAIIPPGYPVNAPGISVHAIFLRGSLTIHGDSTVEHLSIKGDGSLGSDFANEIRLLTVTGNLEHDGSSIVANVVLPDGATMDWKRGLVSGHVFRTATEAIKVMSGATLNLPGPETKVLGSLGKLINQGTVNLTGGVFFVQDPFSNTSTAPDVINEGVFNMEGNARIESTLNRMMLTSQSGATFRSRSGTNTVVLNFQNLGVLDVEADDLIFSQLSLLPASSVIGAGALHIDASSRVYCDGPIVMNGNIELAGGIIEGDAEFTGNGSIHWTAGSIGTLQVPYTSPIPANVHVAPGMTLNITGGLDKRLGAPESFCGPCHRQHGVIINAGTVNMSGSGNVLSGWGGGEIFNSGTFNILEDGQFLRLGDNGAFTNQAGGTLRKSSAGTSSFGAGFGLVNHGTVEVDNGTLDCPGGVALRDGSSVMGAGKLLSTASLTISGIASVVGVDTDGGTVEFRDGLLYTGDGVSPSGTIATADGGKFEWTGGHVAGSLVIAAGAKAALTGSNPKKIGYFGGNYYNFPGSVTNHGTVTWTGSGPIENHNTGLFLNHGTFIIQNTASIGTHQFDNFGTVLKESGEVSSVAGGPFLNHGTIDCQAGELLFETAFHLRAGSNITGSGRVASQGGLHISDGTGVSGAGTLELRGGILSTGNGVNPTGTIGTSGDGKFEWTGGHVTGSLIIAAGAKAEITGSNPKPIGYYGGNYYSFPGSLTNHGTLIWSGAGAIENHNTGLFLNHGTFVLQNTASINTHQFDNFGTVRKESAGVSSVVGGPFLNHGTIDCQAGELLVQSGFQLHANSIVTGGGRVASQGGLHIAAGTSVTGTGASAGTLEFRDNILSTGGGGGTLTTTGDAKFEWTNGYLGGALTIAAGSRCDLVGPNDKKLGYYFAWYANNPGYLTNHGTVTWSGTGGLHDHNYGHFYNHGTFRSQSSGLMSGRLENNGIMEIGSPTGTHTFAGAWFTQTATGKLIMDIGGVAPGSGFDTIAANAVTLGGTLEVRLANGFVPVPGEVFPIISAAYGNFSTVQLPVAGQFTVKYEGTQVNLLARAFEDTLENWTVRHYSNPLAPEAQPNADSNGNRISNLLEYATGRSPTRPGTGSATSLGGSDGQRLEIEGQEYLAFTYRRPGGSASLPDIIYTSESASSPAQPDWSSVDTVVHSVSLDPETLMETVTVRSVNPITHGGTEFLRLRVNRVTP